jgi:uncharacterized protein
MDENTLQATLDWIDDLKNTVDRLDITFHGGEPLTAGIDFYRQALPRLRQINKTKGPKLNIQSNLWLLTEEFCELFEEYGLSLGTSLDGPEEITDNQRGRGYFRRTMEGIKLARRHGLPVGCICTFTRQSASHADEIIDFFLHEGLSFTVHAAVPPLVDSGPEQEPYSFLAQAADRWSLSPEAYGRLLMHLLDSYLLNYQRMRIGTLDQLSRSISSGEGGICTYRDCLGCYLAIAPDGSIYPCQRFTGINSFRLGQVRERPGREQLEQAPAWKMFRQREEHLRDECGDCLRFNICKGGCPYNALAVPSPAHGSGLFHSLKDPYCPSYQRIFSHITERALEEVFSEENMEAVMAQPDGRSLLRKGALLTIIQGGSRLRQGRS